MKTAPWRFFFESGRLRIRFGIHADLEPVFILVFELYNAFRGGVNRVILADGNVLAAVEFGSALSHDDIAGQYVFAAVPFHAKALAVTVAAVSGASEPFLMCHTFSLIFFLWLLSAVTE